ncbi:MAG TPA: hypothetical protein VIX20_12110 [Ktedonobacteraceae bacterium]|jgi:hypothetical protein
MRQLSIFRRYGQATGGALERLAILSERKQHVLQAATFGVLVALLLLTSCTSPASPGTADVGATPPMRTVTVMPTPSPTEPKLGAVPQHCPVSNPTPHMSLTGLGPVIGTSPVWADWPQGGVIAHLSQADPNIYEPPYGWAILKTIWEVEPNYTHSVTVRGYDLFDHTQLLIQFLDNPPTADAVLDPQHPDHPVSVVGEGWAEWGSVFVVPKAGCYVVEVSWPTGHWSVTFAAGA